MLDPQIKQRDEKYKRLPESIQDYFASGETIRKITVIEEKYNLDLEQISGLILIIKKILVGEVRLKEMPDFLVQELKLGKVIAKNLAQDIIREIFYPIKKELKKALPNTPQTPPESKPEPRLEGNIVDLKNH